MEERRLIIQVKGTEPVIDYVIGNNKHVKYYDTQFRVAGLAVQSIVKRSIEIKKEEARNKVSSIHDNLIHNIIPFIGERGVGKTSALISFANILREYEGETNEYLNFGNDKDIRFTCLNSIDGSLLEQGEDIFKVILAQMYLEFDKVSKEARRRWDAESNHSGDDKKLRNEFQELYKKLIHLNGDEREKALIGLVSPLESLQWLSSSLDLKKDFERIIKLYLSVMSELSSRVRYSESSVCNSAKHFLVVVIDDLDLNINNGYEMLEKLHRYVMLPNVIILLAVDLKQLTRLCEKHFYDMTPLVDSKLNDQSDVISQLAQDYLNKVMPYHFRVHMPNFGSSNTLIDDTDNRKPDNKFPSSKEAIFNLLFRKIGIRLDVNGVKKHFFEPQTFRTYISFYLLLKEMDNIISEKGVVDLDVFEHNFIELYADVCSRMIPEMLDDTDEMLFDRIVEYRQPLPRSFRNLYTFLRDFKEDKDDKNSLYFPQHRMNAFVPFLEKFDYSYGEVMRIIYCWGRTSKRMGIDGSGNAIKFKSNKDMTRSLMAYYSLEMIRAYYYYRFSNDPNRRRQERTNIIETLNGSFAGSWALKMMPMIRDGSADDTGRILEQIGCRAVEKMEEVFHFDFDSYALSGLERHKYQEKVHELTIKYFDAKLQRDDVQTDIILNSVKRLTKNRFKNTHNQIEKIYRSFVILSMFFDHPYYKYDGDFRWEFNIPIDEQRDYPQVETITELMNITGKYDVRCRRGKAVFNVFNFVSTSFQYEDVFINNSNETGVNFLTSLSDFFGSGGFDKSLLNEVTLNIVESFNKWRKYSGGFVLPFYNFDLCYNIAKRIRQHRYGQENSVNILAFLDYLKTTFNLISKELSINDAEYAECGFKLTRWEDYDVWKEWNDTPSEVHISFQDAFEHCPFVEWINDYSYAVSFVKDGEKYKSIIEGNGTYLSDSFAHMFVTLVRNVITHSDDPNKGISDNNLDFSLPSHDD